MPRRYTSWLCIAAAAAIWTTPYTATAQAVESLSDEEVELEILELEQRRGPTLVPAGAVLGVGLGLGLVGGVVAFAGGLSNLGCFGYSCSAGGGGSGVGIMGAVIASAGGVLAIVGIVWLIERAGPYLADAPRRDRIGELRRERRRRARERRARVSFTPDVQPLSGGVLFTGTFVL